MEKIYKITFFLYIGTRSRLYLLKYGLRNIGLQIEIEKGCREMIKGDREIILKQEKVGVF